jgi:hypothetical protein
MLQAVAWQTLGADFSSDMPARTPEASEFAKDIHFS